MHGFVSFVFAEAYSSVGAKKLKINEKSEISGIKKRWRTQQQPGQEQELQFLRIGVSVPEKRRCSAQQCLGQNPGAATPQFALQRVVAESNAENMFFMGFGRL